MKYKILTGFLLITSALVYSQTAKKKVTRLANYETILKNDKTRVKMEVFDKESVESSKIYDLNSLEIPENKKVNLTYDDKITRVNDQKIPEELTTTFPAQEFKVVPEILFSKVKGADEIVSYRIYFTSSKPFKYNHDKQQFDGGLGFVLVNALDNEVVSELEDPVYVEIVSSEIQDITPKKLEINHLSLPSSEITMTEKDGVDSLQLKIITQSNLEGYETFVPIEPTINVSAQETKIMGLGFEKTRLDVNVVGSSSSKPIEVSFPNGKVTPSKIIVSTTKTASVELRSGNSLGAFSIEASGRGVGGQNYTSNTIEVNYIFPWLFLLFSIIGGLLGHIARYRKNTKSKYIYLGMIDGLITTVFYFILKIPIPKLGELDFVGAVIFGLAILGGFATITRIFPFVKAFESDNEQELINQ